MNWELIIYILVTIGIIAFILILNSVRVMIDKKIKQMTDDSKEIEYNNAITVLDWVENTIIPNIVTSLNETVTKKYKEASEDGKLTKEEANELFTTAVEDVKKQLSKDIVDKLSFVVGDLNSWIESAIEVAVKNAKDDFKILSIESIEPFEEAEPSGTCKSCNGGCKCHEHTSEESIEEIKNNDVADTATEEVPSEEVAVVKESFK